MLFKGLVILAATSSVLAAPLMERQSNASTCTDPDLRRAWHTLKDSEKKAYIDAELCLMSKPAAHGLRGARTLFDEMQSVHVLQSEIAHWVGQFFPFHRLYLRAHEYLLQTECGYEGAHPYWAEDLDAGAFSNATIFSAENGFGGNGVGDLLCVEDGPFANYTNPLGPGYKVSDHCIERRFADRVSRGSSAAVVEACMAKTNFLEFWNCVEMTSHGAGHGGVGAQMTNPISSPGDPIFYMHHAWLDRIWAKWQEEDPSVRMTEMGGNNRPRLGMAMPGAGGNPFGSGPPTPGLGSMEDMIRPDDVPAPAIIGDPGNVTTLNHLITMYGILPNRTISEVMNTKGSYLCYEYD